MAKSIKSETGLRPNSAGIPFCIALKDGGHGVSNFWASIVGLIYKGSFKRCFEGPEKGSVRDL